MKTFQILSWITLLLSVTQNIFASHLRSAEIIARRAACSSYTYEIIIVGYVNLNSGVSFGGSGDVLSFGDGEQTSIPELVPQVIDPVLGVGRVEFKILHTYTGPGGYSLSFTEANRNEGILNISNAVNTPLSTETYLFVDAHGCNSTPALLVPPIDRACRGVTFYHNPGAVDPDDDSLSYQLVPPKGSLDVPVTGYALPTDPKFYGAGFNQGNENQNGIPSITFSADGTLTWDAPGAIGEYTIAIKVTEWKFNVTDSIWYEAGHIVRDMQIIVEDCLNKKPNLTIPESFCVIAGSTIQFNVDASDPDNNEVVIEAYSEAFSLAENPATVTPQNGAIQSTLPPNTATMQFTWNTSCAHVKEQAYQVTFKISDRPPSGPRLVRFKSLQIKILAPAPEHKSVSVNPVNRQVVLQWKDYNCENVRTFQVWRRVAKYDYEQPECDNGMPYNLRYRLITVLPADASGYTDNDLAIGAQYCYRIVALVGNNKIPSRVSLDTCIIPKPAEAPVITNVSVVKTSASAGEILLRWTSPFDIDPRQYPPPYKYKVYRAEGLTEGNPYIAVTPVPLADTVFTDSNLNTEKIPYHYRVELYVPALTQLPVDTSSVASSVFVTATSKPTSIDLTWEANTPWYNYTQNFPYHLIYRAKGSPEEFTLIDSVDVNENGFTYTDDGKFGNESLSGGIDYYYKIRTRGAYGNPRINQPLENFSEVSRSQLLDTIPPCNPVAMLDKIECKSMPCSANKYFNKLDWAYPGNCTADVASYRVYVSDQPDGQFVLLAETTENTITHTNLQSPAKCYSVTAVDYAGNESDYSDVQCGDNCPYFELPNVFTPGNEDKFNDFFTAFTSESRDTTKCARFVVDLDVSIYDRWGHEVFSEKSIIPEGNFILWDGRTNTGKEAGPGIYFYSANVRFDVRDPSQQKKQFKGWVHLVQ